MSHFCCFLFLNFHTQLSSNIPVHAFNENSRSSLNNMTILRYLILSSRDDWLVAINQRVLIFVVVGC